MKTKMVKSSILIIAVMLMGILFSLGFLGLGHEVEAEVQRSNFEKVSALSDQRSSEGTVIWIAAELWDGNRNYGHIQVAISVSVDNKLDFHVNTIVGVVTQDYKSDDYITESFTYGYNITNAGLKYGVVGYDTIAETGKPSHSSTTSSYFSTGGNTTSVAKDKDSSIESEKVLKKNNNPITVSNFKIARKDIDVEQVSLEFVLTGLDILGVGWAKNTNISDKQIFSINMIFDREMGQKSTPSATINYAPSVLRNIEVLTISHPQYHNIVPSGSYPHINI